MLRNPASARLRSHAAMKRASTQKPPGGSKSGARTVWQTHSDEKEGLGSKWAPLVTKWYPKWHQMGSPMYTLALAHVLQTAFCNSAISNRSPLGGFWNQNSPRGDILESAQRPQSHQAIMAKAQHTVYIGPGPSSSNCLLQFGEIQ